MRIRNSRSSSDCFWKLRYSSLDPVCLNRLFDRTGREVRRREFPTGGAYTSSIREGSLDLRGDRVTRLGTNMCVNTSPNHTHEACQRGEVTQACVFLKVL